MGYNFDPNYLPLNGGTMTGNLILNGDPSSVNQAANKNYVDMLASGLNIQGACYAASTTSLTATYSNGASGVGATLTNGTTLSAFSIDGVSPPINSRILIKDQSTTYQNGIYTLTTVGSGAVAWVLTRSTDYDTPAEVQAGDFVIVQNGTINAHLGFVETATVTTIGTDPITFVQFGTTNASTATIVDDTTTNATMYPAWVTASSGALPFKVSSTKLTFNPSTSNLTATTFTGSLVGNASTVTNGVYTSGSYSDPAWITSLAGSKIAGPVAQSDGIGTTTITTNAAFYPLFVTNNGAFYQTVGVNGSLNYNPSSGALSATTFSGAFSGTATNATNIAVTDSSTNATMYPLFSSVTSGNTGAKLSSLNWSFNPATSAMSIAGIVNSDTQFQSDIFRQSSISGQLKLYSSSTSTAADGILMTADNCGITLTPATNKDVTVTTSGTGKLAAANITATKLTLTSVLPANALDITGGNLRIQQAAVGSNSTLRVTNTDNTNASSGAAILINCGGTSAGDAYTSFNNGTQIWSMGLDNSDSGKFKIDANQTLGANTAITIDSSLNVAFAGAVTARYPTTDQTTTSVTMAVNNAYSANNAGLVTLTLPTTAVVGDVVSVSGLGAGGWRIAQNASQLIHLGSSVTTTGTGGRLDSTNQYDTVTLRCVVANTTWNAISVIGNITVT